MAFGAHLEFVDRTTAFDAVESLQILLKNNSVWIFLELADAVNDSTPALNFGGLPMYVEKLQHSELCKERKHCEPQHLERCSFARLDGATSLSTQYHLQNPPLLSLRHTWR